jgi:ABC-2 type transport system ATP-binding protein
MNGKNGKAIRVEGLVRKFGDLVAVNEISFEVEKGEIFGFLGPNGAGKTTTISMLCTLLKPTAGRAWLDGYDIVNQKNSVRRSIGLVFQDPSLDDQLTARENLEFHATIYRVPVDVKEQRISDVLDIVDLTDRADHRVETFSGGMRRRLEIARGLLHYPKVFFLDEPTVGLDPQTRNYIWDYIHDLKKKEDITIFLTTHYMEEAEHCDRIAIIDYGKIVALDTPENLKDLIGGDVIEIKTVDDAKAEEELEKKFNINIMHERNCICFKVEKGEKFIPNFIRDFGVQIESIELHRPTLDDVFIQLTGREIREESADKLSNLRNQGRVGRR